MREVCFCGWSGEIADRRPVYLGDGEMGLACPNCGDLDRMDWLPDTARRSILLDALLRQDARDVTLDRAA